MRLLKESLITKAPRSGGANAFFYPFLRAHAVDMGFGLEISIGILLMFFGCFRLTFNRICVDSAWIESAAGDLVILHGFQ